jgi:solute carrier family 1 (neutral amino acid transporter) protein 5
MSPATMSPTTNDAKTSKNSKNEDAEVEEVDPNRGCGPMARYPLLSVIAFAAVGVAVGLGLSFWEDDGDTKSKVIKWVGLVGDLFIRALKCVVLPLVFINVVISVVDMMVIGRAGSIGWKTIALYTMTTLIASVLGIIAILAFKPLFRTDTFAEDGPATIMLGCNADGSFITEGSDGSLSCASDGLAEDSMFIIDDLTGSFVRTSGGISDSVSLSDTVYEGVFTKLVTDNITGAFAESNFAAVVFCAIVFGVALSRVIFKKGEGNSFIMPFLKEIDSVLLMLINWIISITPFAVLSLIASAVGGQDDLIDSFANVGYLVLASCFGMAMQFLIVHVVIYYLITKTNPFTYLKCIIPAQTMAFACASSAATIPMTLKSVRSTGVVPESVLRFVIPLGATVNMDGSAIYFPCACIWLAVLNGIEPNIAHYFLLVIIATVGSAGTAPVPSAGLVLIITAYNTVFGTTGIPDGFSYVVAIDWFLDRCITVTNVTGDAMVCGMVSHLCPVDEEDIHDAKKPAQSSVAAHKSEDEEISAN